MHPHYETLSSDESMCNENIFVLNRILEIIYDKMLREGDCLFEQKKKWKNKHKRWSDVQIYLFMIIQ